jgi:hypothetical protein
MRRVRVRRVRVTSVAVENNKYYVFRASILALVIPYANRVFGVPHNIANSGQSGSIMFCQIIPQAARSAKESHST